MRGMARGYAAGNARGPGWREFAGTLGQSQAGRQAGSGMARSRAKARVNWDSQGQRRGRCRVRRRAERVIRPTRAKTRRRGSWWHGPFARPIRAVQRARLCDLDRQCQAPLAAKRPDGMWFSPTPYLRSRMAFSTSARAMIGSSGGSPHRGRDGRIAAGGEEGELGTGRRLHPHGQCAAPARRPAWSGTECKSSRTSAAPSIQ